MSRLIVLSDLHLPPDPRLGNFSAGSALTACIRREAERRRQNPGTETILVLAGDFMDFLLIEGRESTLRWPEIPEFIGRALHSFDHGHDWSADLWAAFRAFTGSGGRLVLLPGNHDPEWLHPAAAAILEQRTGPVFIHREAAPWQTRCGTREVTVTHGDAWDTVNHVDVPGINAALAAGNSATPMPAGSELVLNVFNRLKLDGGGNPGPAGGFLDALKPELPAVLYLLLYLDAPLTIAHLKRRLPRFAARMIVEKLRAELRRGPMFGPPAAAPADAAGDLAGELAAGILAEMPPGLKQAPEMAAEMTQDWLEGRDHPGRSRAAGMLAQHGGTARYLLRAWLRRLDRDGSGFFDTGVGSTSDQAAIQALLPPRRADSPPRVLVTGHTHAARRFACHDDEECVYINSGTWTRLMKIPRLTDDDATAAFIDALEDGIVETAPRLTYAEVSPAAAELRFWPG